MINNRIILDAIVLISNLDVKKIIYYVNIYIMFY